MTEPSESTQTDTESTSDRRESVSRVIAASPQQLFDVVADPTLHHVIDGSGSVKGTRGGSRKLALGDRFSTSMRIGVPYLIRNTVVEYQEGRRIAWAHIGGWRWRFEFEPDEDDDNATLVTETFDWSTTHAGFYIRMMNWAPKNRSNIERTLERLDAFVTNTSSPL